MRTPAFDHIAIAARSLDEGAAWLTDRLGIAPEPGGKHPAMGTHNLLLSLGPGEYLELIAVDPDAPDTSRARWFGLDRFDGPPRLAGWVMRQSPLDPPVGTSIAAASRGDLRWRITLPDSGQMPQDGAQPMRIDWGSGAHPSDRLPDRGLRLSGLTLPLDRMPLDDPRLRQGGFGARIATPAGEVAL
ncbi:VOC family protein [Paracoccus sediminis]|uniref:Glyoxalase-like domain-containing protein n=1 Tax=Paracoccus sediminis TaxID=1214787 RepID=A0A238XF59_9RHOB|nr:VOC family protein [Paracoccus sediminis]TBN49663.1 VOC family protein [Paracoccus sediminis]SNR56964.1 Glyoxalase-like domain-containing protein [Paracoccus sediminis]